MTEQAEAKDAKGSGKPTATPPKDSAKTPDKKPQKRRRSRIAEAEKTVVFEIDHLRRVTKQIAKQYVDILDSEIVQVRESVLAGSGSSGRLSRLNKMLETIEGLNVQPDKGRRKDLRRISKLIAHLNRIVEKI